MIKELSYLPVWYADPEDFVFTEEIVSPRFFFPFRDRKVQVTAFPQFFKKRMAMWGKSPGGCLHFGQAVLLLFDFLA